MKKKVLLMTSLLVITCLAGCGKQAKNDEMAVVNQPATVTETTEVKEESQQDTEVVVEETQIKDVAYYKDLDLKIPNSNVSMDMYSEDTHLGKASIIQKADDKIVMLMDICDETGASLMTMYMGDDFVGLATNFEGEDIVCKTQSTDDSSDMTDGLMNMEYIDNSKIEDILSVTNNDDSTNTVVCLVRDVETNETSEYTLVLDAETDKVISMHVIDDGKPVDIFITEITETDLDFSKFDDAEIVSEEEFAMMMLGAMFSTMSSAMETSAVDATYVAQAIEFTGDNDLYDSITDKLEDVVVSSSCSDDLISLTCKFDSEDEYKEIKSIIEDMGGTDVNLVESYTLSYSCEAVDNSDDFTMQVKDFANDLGVTSVGSFVMGSTCQYSFEIDDITLKDDFDAFFEKSGYLVK